MSFISTLTIIIVVGYFIVLCIGAYIIFLKKGNYPYPKKKNLDVLLYKKGYKGFHLFLVANTQKVQGRPDLERADCYPLDDKIDMENPVPVKIDESYYLLPIIYKKSDKRIFSVGTNKTVTVYEIFDLETQTKEIILLNKELQHYKMLYLSMEELAVKAAQAIGNDEVAAQFFRKLKDLGSVTQFKPMQAPQVNVDLQSGGK